MRTLAALLAGAMLFLSDQPLVWWPLQLVALIPLWLALASGPRPRWSPLLGLVFGTGYTLPLLLVAGHDEPILALGALMLLEWVLIAWCAAHLLRRGPVLGALATAAVVTLAELALWQLPLFGTGQSFVRPLSQAPLLIAFAAFTGTGGVVFVIAALQALLANALRGTDRSRPLLAALALLALVAGLDWQRWTRPLGTAVRVAALGWNDSPSADGRSGEVFERGAADAVAAGAQLLVTPETSGSVGQDRRPAAIEKLGALARQHALWIAFGVWHAPTRDNRIWFFDPSGELRAEYRKTHLIPWLEDYVAGDGTLISLPFADLTLGGMICQDDNFTDLARGYGRAGTRLLAVPTNDWPSIRGFHFENGIFRAIENGYAVVRAASGGISALVSPRGEVVASCDHVLYGPKLVHGLLPTGDGQPTWYAKLGDVPMLVTAVVLLLAALLRRGRR
jgi:apolipoprotein N-acyltransferase